MRQTIGRYAFTFVLMLGRKRVALLGVILGCIGFLLIGLATEIMLLAASVLLAGLSVGAMFPVSVAVIADGIHPRLRGGAMGFFEMICAIALMVASALGGAAAQVLSPRTPYGVSAIVYICCAVALYALLPRRPPRELGVVSLGRDYFEVLRFSANCSPRSH